MSKLAVTNFVHALARGSGGKCGLFLAACRIYLPCTARATSSWILGCWWTSGFCLVVFGVIKTCVRLRSRDNNS